jgi:hypothetical protein
VIRDVSAGKAGLGWAGTRVFDELADPAFTPLLAPMLIDPYELEESVLSDPIVAPLHSLGELHLQGIGVLPGPLRRSLGKHPLRGPTDWTDARIAWTGGVQTATALRSLGAKVGCAATANVICVMRVDDKAQLIKEFYAARARRDWGGRTRAVGERRRLARGR